MTHEWLIFTSTYWSSRTVASETRARDWSGWIYSFLFIYLLWIQTASFIIIIIILTFTWYEAIGNHLSPLIFTFRLSVLLSSCPRQSWDAKWYQISCGAGHGRCSALLCSLVTESRPRRYNSTTLAVQMQWYCIDLFSWMNAHPFNWDQMRKQEKMLFSAAWKIKGKDIFSNG